ncbi:hypothetical protein S7711_02056 [Stachybotrys chartarum IBT 7711]|uniref:Major facilitator superfamily (MFS) profile domain-containing protein n=1 Tax=Stachybotrys chartarum (strain CBS 109288 / IBT 7711) TaxID=1280523 RepID=A0A084AW40_STACB|nr:hypothetical protein S7711_02056 [Stachybotrys chartarum IBT 7711]
MADVKSASPGDGLGEVQYATSVPPMAQDGDDSRAHRTIIQHAKAAATKEQKMTLLQGIRLYPKAIAWSVLISTCIVMEGYDVTLSTNFFAFPQFCRKYGVQLEDDTWEIPAAWQAGLSNGVYVGEMIGLILNGIISERYGYRYTVMGCLVLLTGFITIFFTAQNVQTLLAAEILCGIPWGVFQTLTITYASEVCPVALRGYLTTYINCCWGIGQIIGIGVIRSMLDRDDEWSYRIPYALQWIWPLPLFVGVYFAPESPWWLVRKGRTQDAKKALLRLTSLNRETDFDADETVAMMVHTTALEQKITSGASYWDCFKGVDLRRTEIVCMVWAIQNLSGNGFSNYSTYFLRQAGLQSRDSYSFALGQYAINCVGTFFAWGLMTYGLGRRTLYLYGTIGLFIMLAVMGFLGLVPESNREDGALATGSMMIAWALVYQLSVGTVAYSLVAELSSRRLQIKTVVLGRNLYLIVAIINGVFTPYMLNPGAWNWGNYAAFFWAGSCFLCIIYVFFRLPEPRGRTFAELDVLFEKKISARKFASTHVDVFQEMVEETVMHRYEQIEEPRSEKSRDADGQLDNNKSTVSTSTRSVENRTATTKTAATVTTSKRQVHIARYDATLSASRTPPIHAPRFHLIQEDVAFNLYELLIAATLWNRTKGSQARPVFMALRCQYPSPEHLGNAAEADLTDLLRPLGLQHTRARRFLAFAQTWVQTPPAKNRRYRRLNYPRTGSGRDVAPTEVLGDDDPRDAWDIAHLPGTGPYALDSFRIFHRDVMRGLAEDWVGTGGGGGFEPEWKRVVPQDKELKAYIRWMWLKEGWIWDPETGRRVKASRERMRAERARKTSLSPELM